MAKMKSAEFVAQAANIAENYKTSYIWGGLGRPITEATIKQAIDQYTVNNNYASGARRYVGQKDAFYFDCVGLIKSILWGWCGNAANSMGGAIYTSNGVPDISADTMIGRCSGVSTDFSEIQVGEVLWMPGHIGIYVGDGLGVECTPVWKNGVQYSAVANIGSKAGYNSRRWTKHGKLPYVDYSDQKGSAAIKQPWEETLQNAVDLGIINSPDYWRKVLAGTEKASAANVKALMDKYNARLGKK